MVYPMAQPLWLEVYFLSKIKSVRSTLTSGGPFVRLQKQRILLWIKGYNVVLKLTWDK